MMAVQLVLFTMLLQLSLCQRCKIVTEKTYCEGEGGTSVHSNAGSLLRGEAGSPGKRGPVGPQGPQGPIGPPGPPGNVDSAVEMFQDFNHTFANVAARVSDLEVNINQTLLGKPRSCQTIKTFSPDASSGVYIIHDSHGIQYQTYCDMETNGGGWSLVASIHENNAQPNGECTTGDRWSSQHGNSQYQPKSETWENMNVFGNVVAATDEDFKNPGYFDIEAKNIMIWQSWRSSSYFRYRTTSNFLTNYNGNLYNLYKYHYPVVSRQYTWPGDNGPDEPVIFDKGNGSALANQFGPNIVPHLTSGYIQFRVLNGEGDAYALCAGIKVRPDSWNNEHICIGSTGFNIDSRYCGDFAGWSYSGYGTHSAWSVNKQLIESSFLIFYK